jgi:hypothetical protein
MSCPIAACTKQTPMSYKGMPANPRNINPNIAQQKLRRGQPRRATDPPARLAEIRISLAVLPGRSDLDAVAALSLLGP